MVTKRTVLIAATALLVAVCVIVPVSVLGARADTVPPSVGIASPADGATVGGKAAISGPASDNRKVKSVTVRVDDGPAKHVVGTAASTGSTAATTWSYALDTASLPDGMHVVKATAYDQAGNVSSDTVNVNVSNASTKGAEDIRAIESASQSANLKNRPRKRGTKPAPTPQPAPPTPAPSPAGSKPAVGVQFHGLWGSYGAAQQTAVLDKLGQAHVNWIRVDLGWASVEEHGRGQIEDWYLAAIDKVITRANSHGIKVLGTLWSTPNWANGGKGNNAPPSNPADYGKIAEFMAKHFGDRIPAWEVWNEPNLDSFWTGSVSQYVSLMKAGYAGFKRGNPGAQVVLGGPSYNDTNWLKQMYAAGGHGAFDIMSTHPYMGKADAAPELEDGTIWTITHVREVLALMKQYGDGAKKIWFTEFGWSTHSNTSSTPNWERGVSPQTQADYLIRTLELVRTKFPYVTNVFWYNERDNDTSGSQYGSFGLLKRDLTPKPAYYAMRDYLA